VSVGSSSPTFPVSASRTYYFNVYYNAATNAFGVASYSTTAPTNAQILADCYSDGRVGIYTSLAITTPASGSGGGSGGGGGGGSGNSCPAEYQRVLTKERGYIRADEVDIGMHFPSRGGWVRVNEAIRLPTTIWRFKVESTLMRESFDVNDTHAVREPSGEWLVVTSMRPGMKLKSNRDRDLTIIDARAIGPGYFIAFDVDTHEFEMGESCAHNITTL
jgi:hypothetical protein